MVDPALIEQFQAVTGASAEQATFFLESFNGSLDAAVVSFMDTNAGQASAPPQAAAAGSSAIPTAQEVVTRSARIATLGSKPAQKDDENTYYAGGKNSGVAIQGRPDAEPKSVVDEIMKLAKEGGRRPDAEEASDEGDYDSDVDDDAPQKVQAFTGAGYRLGSSEDAAPAAAASAAAASAPAVNNAPAAAARGKVTRTITFWKDGFSIDDGPLFPFSDPKSQQILESIKQGRAPLHILNVAQGQPVDLKVAHRMEDEYKPPPAKPFSGQGNRLGSVVPGDIASSPAPSPAAAAPSASAAQGPAAPALAADPSLPTTSVQIRLADGTRMVFKLNHSHTVGELRRAIGSARPGQRAFTLNTTFPMKELKEDALTIEAAGLLNSVVVQKWA